MRHERRVPEARSLRDFFADQWAHIRLRVGEDAAQKRRRLQAAAATDDAVEDIVDGTDVKLRLLLGYRRRLRQGARALLDHVERITDAVPAAIPMDKRAFANSPEVNAFFVSTAHMTEVFDGSPTLRELFCTSDLRQAYLVLSMVKQERTGFGFGLQGEMVVREVPQTTVSFSEHQVLGAAPSEAGARSQLKQYFFERTIDHLRARMGSLAAQTGKKGSLDDYMDGLVGLLSQPSTLIRMETSSLRVNRMGVRTAVGSNERVNEVTLREATIGDATAGVLVLGYCERADVSSERKLFKQAAAALGKHAP